ncbi:hypothetical protein PVAG01_10973 [Phlyctema vagabunda]|uniref:DUF1254 domain-containing protein n=1 Tax=Phlyctema vagabunda TaxID=108571 RepID=A0ABR4P3R6_9HELO
MHLISSLSLALVLGLGATAAVLPPDTDASYSSNVSPGNSSISINDAPAFALMVFPTDRFYIVPFYDLYSNSFANLGSISNSPPGDYLLTAAGDDEAGIWLVGEGYESNKYKGIIKFPTTYGSIMMRIVIKNSGSDLEKVHAIQSQVKMATIERGGETLAAALTQDSFELEIEFLGICS